MRAHGQSALSATALNLRNGHNREHDRPMNVFAAAPERLCLACDARDPIRSDEPLWPLGWHCPACGRRVAERAGIPMFAPELADTISGFDPAAFATLIEIEATHFWFVARNELIVGLANRFFPSATRYLEIGCGNGAVLGALAGSRAWERLAGSDLHPAGLEHARTRLPREVELVQMDARAIPAVNAFDLTGAFDVVEHVADDEAVLQGLRRATATGGGTIIAVPQHPLLWSRADEIGHHQRRYRLGELEVKLEHNGFNVLFSSSFTAVLLPLLAANRLKARVIPGRADCDIEHEIAPGPWLNGALTTILRAEVRLTLAGLRWPIGGSRVVVARAV
jgi:SAM-dependent methyltransferase